MIDEMTSMSSRCHLIDHLDDITSFRCHPFDDLDMRRIDVMQRLLCRLRVTGQPPATPDSIPPLYPWWGDAWDHDNFEGVAPRRDSDQDRGDVVVRRAYQVHHAHQ